MVRTDLMGYLFYLLFIYKFIAFALYCKFTLKKFRSNIINSLYIAAT